MCSEDMMVIGDGDNTEVELKNKLEQKSSNQASMKNKRFVSTMPHSNFNLSSDRGREPVLFSSEGILMESKTNSDVILNHD